MTAIDLGKIQEKLGYAAPSIRVRLSPGGENIQRAAILALKDDCDVFIHNDRVYAPKATWEEVEHVTYASS